MRAVEAIDGQALRWRFRPPGPSRATAGWPKARVARADWVMALEVTVGCPWRWRSSRGSAGAAGKGWLAVLPTFLTSRENFSWSNHEGDVLIALFWSGQLKFLFQFGRELIENQGNGRGRSATDQAQRHAAHAGVDDCGVARSMAWHTSSGGSTRRISSTIFLVSSTFASAMVKTTPTSEQAFSFSVGAG